MGATASSSSSSGADRSGMLWLDHLAGETAGAQVAGGVLTGVHSPDACAGRACAIHRPSDHPLAAAPLNWRADRRIMERLCVHGIGHPDPDDAAYRVEVFGDTDTVHGCDGCCRG